MIHAALASTREYIKTRPDNVRRFLQAYLEEIKSLLYGSRTRQTSHRQIHQDHRRSRPRNPYQTFLPAWERLPLIPAAAVQTMLNFATHPGAKTAKPETFIDNSILIEIGKSGFVDRLYK